MSRSNSYSCTLTTTASKSVRSGCLLYLPCFPAQEWNSGRPTKGRSGRLRSPPTEPDPEGVTHPAETLPLTWLPGATTNHTLRVPPALLPAVRHSQAANKTPAQQPTTHHHDPPDSATTHHRWPLLATLHWHGLWLQGHRDRSSNGNDNCSFTSASP